MNNLEKSILNKINSSAATNHANPVNHYYKKSLTGDVTNNAHNVHFKNLIDDDNGWNCLTYFFDHGYKNGSLTEDEIDYLIKNSDLKYKTPGGGNALMSARYHIIIKKVPLSDEQVDYLIKNSDLKQADMLGWNNLMFFLRECKDGVKTNLNNEQWQSLIDNSNLLQIEMKEEEPRSVLGLAVQTSPNLMNLIFQRVINDKNFNLDNYKNAECYKEICQIAEVYKTKRDINKKMKAPQKNEIKNKI